MPRLFVAVSLPDAQRALLAALRDAALPARWTPAEQLHLTLRFIGDADDGTTTRLIETLSALTLPTFRLEGAGLGVFPGVRRARVVYAAVARSAALARLADAVEQAVREAGLPADPKPFRPHVTVARLKDAAPGAVQEYLQRHEGFTLPAFTVDAFHLYASTLRREGALHQRLRDVPLQPDAGEDARARGA